MSQFGNNHAITADETWSNSSTRKSHHEDTARLGEEETERLPAKRYFSGFFEALHESRRQQAARIIRDYGHLKLSNCGSETADEARPCELRRGNS
jgi:hypothetical protein